MYQLIGSPKTRAFRVLWMLEECGQEYALNPTMPQSEEARKANPSGKIPALMVDDTVVLDSVAICQFLADRHNVLTFPAGSIERGVQDSFTQFTVDELEGALWTASKHSFVYPEEKRVPAIRQSCIDEFERALKVLEKRLGDRPFVMGDAFTVPDLLIAHCFMWAKGIEFPLLTEGPLYAYFKRATSRDAFQRAVAKRETAAKA